MTSTKTIKAALGFIPASILLIVFTISFYGCPGNTNTTTTNTPTTTGNGTGKDTSIHTMTHSAAAAPAGQATQPAAKVDTSSKSK